MTYGLESFNTSGVCQFSTNTSTLVKVKEFTPTNLHSFIGGSTVNTSDGYVLYGWDGPNNPSPYWTFYFDMPPLELNNSNVFIFARPSVSNTYAIQKDGGHHSIMMFGTTPSSNLPSRVGIYTNLPGHQQTIDILIASRPGNATPENIEYGLEVYDGNGTSDSNITFSSRFANLQVQEAGTVNSYSTSTLGFDRSYVMPTGTVVSGSDWANDNPPYALISNTGWYGEFGAGIGANPSGARSGDPFMSSGGRIANSMMWEIELHNNPNTGPYGSGAWTLKTGFHLLEVQHPADTSSSINYFGGTSVPHDYLTVREGN